MTSRVPRPISSYRYYWLQLFGDFLAALELGTVGNPGHARPARPDLRQCIHRRMASRQRRDVGVAVLHTQAVWRLCACWRLPARREKSAHRGRSLLVRLTCANGILAGRACSSRQRSRSQTGDLAGALSRCSRRPLALPGSYYIARGAYSPAELQRIPNASKQLYGPRSTLKATKYPHHGSSSGSLLS